MLPVVLKVRRCPRGVFFSRKNSTSLLLVLGVLVVLRLLVLLSPAGVLFLATDSLWFFLRGPGPMALPCKRRVFCRAFCLGNSSL